MVWYVLGAERPSLITPIIGGRARPYGTGLANTPQRLFISVHIPARQWPPDMQCMAVDEAFVFCFPRCPWPVWEEPGIEGKSTSQYVALRSINAAKSDQIVLLC